MQRRIGFACMSKRINIKYKTFRVANFTDEKFHEAVMHNLSQTEKLIDYCIHNDYNMVRLSSDIIPFATHELTQNLRWQLIYDTVLRSIGNKIKQHDIRVSMHPAQYTIINSPKEEVVDNSIKDLQYHCDVLDLMGVDGEVLIHIGGVYGDKLWAINKFIENYNKLPQTIKNRLVIENDDKSFNIEDVLYISEKCNIPVVFDYHHHVCCNIGTKVDMDLLDRISNTWANRNPKVHISSPKNDKEFRSHHDYIDYDYVKDFLELCEDNFDIMVEAKEKDLAVDRLKEVI